MLMIARDYILFRKAVAIAVAGGEYDELRADGLHECFRRRRRAAVMGGDEDLRPEPSAVEEPTTPAGADQGSAPSAATPQPVPSQAGAAAGAETGTRSEPRDDVPTREVAGETTPALAWPVTNGRTAMGFGWQYSETMGDWRWHPGVDLAVPEGTDVLAAADGRVVGVERDAERGLTVTIEHDGGYRTVYASLAEASVEAGQQVRRGQAIGKAGSSARVESAAGVHVHFEIWRGDEAVDPNTVIG